MQLCLLPYLRQNLVGVSSHPESFLNTVNSCRFVYSFFCSFSYYLAKVLHSTNAALHLILLQLFGCGSVAQVTTTQNQKGQYLSINLGFALGVTFGVFLSRGVSGERTWAEEKSLPAVSCVFFDYELLYLFFFLN